MALFHSSVPVNHDIVEMRQHEQHQAPETEAAKWDSVIIHFNIYTCTFVIKCLIASQLIHINNACIIDTFAACDGSIRWRAGHFEGQTVGPLEGVTVSDEESSWLLVL